MYGHPDPESTNTAETDSSAAYYHISFHGAIADARMEWPWGWTALPSYSGPAITVWFASVHQRDMLGGPVSMDPARRFTGWNAVVLSEIWNDSVGLLEYAATETKQTPYQHILLAHGIVYT